MTRTAPFDKLIVGTAAERALLAASSYPDLWFREKDTGALYFSDAVTWQQQVSPSGTFVSPPASPVDGHTLQWNAAQGKYIDAALAAIDSLPVYVATAHGMACDNSTDDTAALNALLATVYAAGGGTIHVPKLARISGQVTLPNDGAAVPNQPPIRITGKAADIRGQTRNSNRYVNIGGLDLRYAGATHTGCTTTALSPIVLDPSSAAGDEGKFVVHANLPDRAQVVYVNPGVGYSLNVNALGSGSALSFLVTGAKFETFGIGHLELDRLQLIDGGGGSSPIGYTTNTTVNVHDCAISGNKTSTCDQDVFVLGGIGDSWVLSSPLTSGTVYTSLAITALPWAISSGQTVQIGVGATTQTVTLSSAAAAGATTLSVSSFTANANYPTQTPFFTGSQGSSGRRSAPFQGFGSRFTGNQFDRVRRLLGQMWCTDVYVEDCMWWQTCGSNLSQIPAKLTSGLTSGTGYTALPVTATPAQIWAGDQIQIGSDTAYQVVIASADTAPGATSIPVNSFTANAAYATNTIVFDSDRWVGAAVEVYGVSGQASNINLLNNRIELSGRYSYATKCGPNALSCTFAFTNIQDTNAVNIAYHRFDSLAQLSLVITGIAANGAIPTVDDMNGTAGVGTNMVLNTRQSKQSRFPYGFRADGNSTTFYGGLGPITQASTGDQVYTQMFANKMQLEYKTAAGVVSDLIGLFKSGHISTLGAAPTVAALAAAGSAATASVSGTDCAGTITLTTGSGSVAAGDQLQLSFATTMEKTARVVLTARGAAAAGLGVPYTTVTTATIKLGLGTAPAISTTYTWDYIVLLTG